MTTDPISIPFVASDRPGQINVSYGRVKDPVGAGFDVIPNLGFDISRTIGYPSLCASLRYDGSGVRSLFGWIQLITNERIATTNPTSAQWRKEVSCDVLPSLMESGMPFMFFGIMPQVFDAPCRNLGQDAELRWYADTFLTNVPIRSRREPIRRIAGFRWGYVEDNTARPQPTSILPLEVTGEMTWSIHLPFLRSKYPNWEFADS